jgi:hypothetical protein
LVNYGTTEASTSAAMLQIDEYMNVIEWLGCSILHYPNSTLGELIGILLALLSTPNNKRIRIHSDSQAVIDRVTYLIKSKGELTPRELFKMNSNIIVSEWIFKVISMNNFDIKLIKVKAHSGII